MEDIIYKGTLTYTVNEEEHLKLIEYYNKKIAGLDAALAKAKENIKYTKGVTLDNICDDIHDEEKDKIVAEVVEAFEEMTDAFVGLGEACMTAVKQMETTLVKAMQEKLEAEEREKIVTAEAALQKAYEKAEAKFMKEKIASCDRINHGMDERKAKEFED